MSRASGAHLALRELERRRAGIDVLIERFREIEASSYYQQAAHAAARSGKGVSAVDDNPAGRGVVDPGTPLPSDPEEAP